MGTDWAITIHKMIHWSWSMNSKNTGLRRCAYSALATVTVLTILIGCSNKQFPDKFKDDREAFDQSLLAFWEAGNMFKRRTDQPMVMRTPQQEDQYFKLLENGVLLGKEVGDEFLAYLHPELTEMFHEFLIPGKRLYAEGAKTGNRIMQSDGSKKVLRWEEFWEAHKSEIVAKAFPEPAHENAE